MKKIFTLLTLVFSLLVSPVLLAEVVNINKASAAALQENLKGIGEKKAQAIVAYRKEFGAFKTLDEIMEVKGIGKGIFKKIKADITLDKGITDLVDKKSAKTAKTNSSKKTVKAPAKKAVKKQAVEKAVKPVTKDKKAKQNVKTKKKTVEKS